MPEQFVSYNPTQVGQGNNIVYQPVEQKYGQLFAHSAGKVAAQKAKAAKDAQEKEYDFKGKFTGSSVFAPEIITDASKALENEFVNYDKASTDRGFQNNHRLKMQRVTNQAKSIADIEGGWKKVIDMANTDVSGNSSPILTKLNANRVVNLAKEKASENKDPYGRLDTYAGVLSATDLQPQAAPMKSLMKQDDGDIYQRVQWENPNLDTTNNPDYLRQSKGDKRSVSVKNFNSLANVYKNDEAIRNYYKHNFLMSSDTPIKTLADADRLVASEFYNYGSNDKNKKVDFDKYETDENYRKEVLAESYKNQDAAINSTIESTLKAKLGIDENYNKDISTGNNMFSNPDSKGVGANKDISITENQKAGIGYDEAGVRNDIVSDYSVNLGKGIDIPFSASDLTNASVYGNVGEILKSGNGIVKVTDIHKTPVFRIGNNKNDITPMYLYKDGEPYQGTYEDAIKEDPSMKSFKVVNPEYLLKTKGNVSQKGTIDTQPDIDKSKNLISLQDAYNNPKWNVQAGYAINMSGVDKAGTTNEQGQGNTVMNQNSTTGSTLYTTRENAANSVFLKKVLATKVNKGKTLGGVDANGDVVVNGATNFNKKKQSQSLYGKVKGGVKKTKASQF